LVGLKRGPRKWGAKGRHVEGLGLLLEELLLDQCLLLLLLEHGVELLRRELLQELGREGCEGYECGLLEELLLLVEDLQLLLLHNLLQLLRRELMELLGVE